MNLPKPIFCLLSITFLLSGCFVIDDSQYNVTTTKTSNSVIGGISELVLLNEHHISSKLTIELINNGFKVKPFVSQQQVTQKTESADVTFNQASTRYGLKINSIFRGMSCFFSTNREEDFTFTLIDMRTNDIVDIYERSGPTGKCPPLTPIYEVYVQHLKSF